MLASTDGRSFETSTVGRLCTISLRGNVSLFKVKDEQSLQSCMLEWQASLAEPFKARNANINNEANPTPVYVEDLRVADDGTVIVFLTDKTRFEYHTGTRLWREINPDIELDVSSKPGLAIGMDGVSAATFTVATSTGQKITSSGL